MDEQPNAMNPRENISRSGSTKEAKPAKPARTPAQPNIFRPLFCAFSHGQMPHKEKSVHIQTNQGESNRQLRVSQDREPKNVQIELF